MLWRLVYVIVLYIFFFFLISLSRRHQMHYSLRHSSHSRSSITQVLKKSIFIYEWLCECFSFIFAFYFLVLQVFHFIFEKNSRERAIWTLLVFDLQRCIWRLLQYRKCCMTTSATKFIAIPDHNPLLERSSAMVVLHN